MEMFYKLYAKLLKDPGYIQLRRVTWIPSYPALKEFATEDWQILSIPSYFC